VDYKWVRARREAANAWKTRPDPRPPRRVTSMREMAEARRLTAAATPERVEALLRESAASGDQATAALCLVALGRAPDEGVGGGDAAAERRAAVLRLGVHHEGAAAVTLARRAVATLLASSPTTPAAAPADGGPT
jgi:hypothetical protein